MRKIALAYPSQPAPANDDLAAFYRQLFRHFPFGMAALHIANPADTSTWRVLATNPTAGRVAGTTVGTLVNLRLNNRGNGEETVNLQELYARVLASGKAKTVGHLVYTYSMGARELYFVHAFPLAGHCLGLAFRDMTIAQEATNKLLEKEWQIGQMCESVRAIIWRADATTLEFSYVSPQAPQVLGYWVERWLHEPNFFRNRVHPDDWYLVQSACADAVTSEKKSSFDCRIYSVKGDLRWFRVFVQRVSLHAGRSELGGAMVDITEQKQAAISARDITLAVMRAQERERKALSSNLHDSIGQNLTSLSFTLGRIQRNGKLSRKIREELQECITTIQGCSNEIRSVSTMLHPPLLELMGLGPALRSYAKKFSEQSGISLHVEAAQGAADLPSEFQIALFRAAQECLTNVQRHSGSKSAKIRLFCSLTEVFLEVEDEGKGVEPDLIEELEAGTGGPGIGLLKMRERIRDLRGNLNIRSNGKGTLICVRIPRSIHQTPNQGARRSH